MRRIVFIVFALLIAAVAHSAPVDRVVFHGNRSLSSADLSELLNLPTSQDISSEDLTLRVQALRDSMFVRDYLFAKVDSFSLEVKKSKSILNVFVTEGRPAFVHSIRWVGETAILSDAVFRRLLTQNDSRLRWSNLKYDMQSLLDHFEEIGYPFAHIEVLSLSQDAEDSSAVNIEMKVLSGPFVRLRFINFSGNKITKNVFLVRETRLKLDESYRGSRIESARRNLKKLPFIRRVAEPKLVVNEQGETGLVFDLEEARMSRIDLVAGFSPGAKERSGTFSGLVDLELLNIFGDGRKARVHWERPDKSIQAIDLAWVEPWVLKQPVSLQFDFNQRIEDTLYVTRQFGAKMSVHLSSYVSVWGTAHREAVIVDSTDATLLGLESSRTNYLETGIEFDSRDHPLNPRSGVYFSTFGGQGWRRLSDETLEGAKKDYIHHRIGIDNEVDFEVLPFWILSVSTHARSLDSDEPEIRLPDLYRLGGARTLRGYREEQFLGSRLGWASLEARYWLGEASRVFLFTDAGGIYREFRELDQQKKTTIYRTSAGLGLRLETGLGVWGIDYGIGESDNLLRGKLHVSLFSSF
jgi:outer membrane protein insertion porin family